MIPLAILILVSFLFIQNLSLWALDFKDGNKKIVRDKLPKVSILLAARNEENLIIRSLTSIANLNYPLDKLEVLIGNDQSTDNTAALVNEFIKDKPNFKLFYIDKNKGKGRGKANVLAHLAHQANGLFFFITDVDVQLPKQWIHDLLGEFDVKVGIVSGTSTCQASNSWFSKMQSIDWLHFMGYIQSFANMNVGCTSVGNNMAVREKAYWQTGGFERIDFSITEDYKLFKEVTKRGWEWRTILTPGSLGLASHIPSWKEMLHQRKRWLIGARELTLDWKMIIILYGLFIPALLFFFIYNPFIAIAIWSLKWLIQSVYIQTLARKVGLKPFSLIHLVTYEVYVMTNTFITAIFFFLPVKTVWKGRIYSHNDLQ